MIQNMPAVADRDAFQRQINAIREEGNANRQQMAALFEQGVAQLRDQIAQGQAQLRGDILQLQGQVGLVQNEQQLLPIRLYNASASELAPPRYPTAIPNDHILPATRRHTRASSLAREYPG